MRPSSPVHATGAGIQNWNSPMPYLFGGIALLLGIIFVALLIIACSRRSSSSSNSSSDDHGEEERLGGPVIVSQPEMEPKRVVIMAGDKNPRYLATPVALEEV